MVVLGLFGKILVVLLGDDVVLFVVLLFDL